MSFDRRTRTTDHSCSTSSRPTGKDGRSPFRHRSPSSTRPRMPASQVTSSPATTADRDTLRNPSLGGQPVDVRALQRTWRHLLRHGLRDVRGRGLGPATDQDSSLRWAKPMSSFRPSSRHGPGGDVDDRMGADVPRRGRRCDRKRGRPVRAPSRTVPLDFGSTERSGGLVAPDLASPACRARSARSAARPATWSPANSIRGNVRQGDQAARRHHAERHPRTWS